MNAPEPVPSPRAALVENVRLARLALAEYDLAMAESEHLDSIRECKCNPDAREFDPYCRVADTVGYIDRAKAEVTRFQPLTG